MRPAGTLGPAGERPQRAESDEHVQHQRDHRQRPAGPAQNGVDAFPQRVTECSPLSRRAAMPAPKWPVSAAGDRVVTGCSPTAEHMEDLAVTGHHVLNEVRRWLVRPGAELRVLALLVASVLVLAGGLLMLRTGTGGADRAEIARIHG